MLLGSRPICTRIFAILRLSAAVSRMRFNIVEKSALLDAIGPPRVIAALVDMPQQARALNDGDHISSIKTDAVALHNRVMCRVGDADQHCGKYSRFLARCGAIFPVLARCRCPRP